MIMNIRNLSLVVVAALALTLSACGGGGGNGPVTSKPTPKVVNLDSVAASAMRPATEEPIVIAPGQSIVHGDVTFSCAAGGPACMVAVEEDGTVSSTGGMVFASNSEAYLQRLQRLTVADATGMAETVINALSDMSADAEIAAAESLLAAAKTALADATALSAADRDALNSRIQSVEMTLGEIKMAVADRGDMDEMERQRLAVADAIGVAESAIGALSDMSTDAEIAAAESLLAAAKSALTDATALSTVDRGALTGRIQTVEMNLAEAKARIAQARHSAMELEQSIEAISAAINQAEFLTDALSRTSSDADVVAVEALLARARTALDAFPPGAILDPLYWSLRLVEETLDGIKTDIAAHRTAVANVIDLAANDNRQDVLDEFIGGWWWREPGTGGQQASVTRSYGGGGSVNAILSYDENGQLQHNVAIFQNLSYQQVETTDIRVRLDRAGRYINTHEDPQELEGVIRSTRSISDHGLGAEWQVTELTSDYDGGGTLKIHVATDVEPADGSVDPFATVASGYGNIELSEAAALHADWDFLVVRFDPGHREEGSLGEDAGFFYCSEPCYLAIDRRSGGYYAVSTGLVFTPYGGTAQPVPPTLIDTAPAADYLAFGHWLYVPDDAAEPYDVPPTLGYDFGVFASGGDPFTAANLRALTGTATYEGDATGMYYVGGLSGIPDVGSFTADVELTADFGSDIETGTIGGQVSDFEFEGDVASSLPETVTLVSRTYDYLPEGFGVEQGTVTNIFDTPWRDEAAPYPGGWVGGATQASVDGQDWYGSWSGALYGNGSAPTDHPTSVAGEFSSYPWGDGNHNQRDTGLTGSFGAHRQGGANEDPMIPDPDPTPPGEDKDVSKFFDGWLDNEWLQFDAVGVVEDSYIRSRDKLLPEHSEPRYRSLSGCMNVLLTSNCVNVEYSEFEEVAPGIQLLKTRGRDRHIYDTRDRDDYLQLAQWALVGGYIALVQADYELARLEGVERFYHASYWDDMMYPPGPSRGRDLPRSAFRASWKGKMIGAAREHDYRPISGDVELQVSFGEDNDFFNDFLSDEEIQVVSFSGGFTNIGNGTDIEIDDITFPLIHADFMEDPGPGTIGIAVRGGHDRFVYNYRWNGSVGIVPGGYDSSVDVQYDDYIRFEGIFEGPRFEEVHGLISTKEVAGFYLAKQYER